MTYLNSLQQTMRLVGAQLNRPGVLLPILMCAAFLPSGCQYHDIVPYAEQEMALLEIVPVGTSREEVAARLNKAGVEYSTSPGPDPGVFYCESWMMDSGESFLLYSELLFDADGRLQEIRKSPSNY